MVSDAVLLQTAVIQVHLGAEVAGEVPADVVLLGLVSRQQALAEEGLAAHVTDVLELLKNKKIFKYILYLYVRCPTLTCASSMWCLSCLSP